MLEHPHQCRPIHTLPILRFSAGIRRLGLPQHASGKNDREYYHGNSNHGAWKGSGFARGGTDCALCCDDDDIISNVMNDCHDE